MLKSQIQACQKLGMTAEEIAELAEADKKIEKGERLFELTAEQKQAERKAKSAGKTVYNFSKPREKKVNDEKLFLISVLQKALETNGCELMLITNPEREFEFTYANKKYKVVMSMPRK